VATLAEYASAENTQHEEQILGSGDPAPKQLEVAQRTFQRAFDEEAQLRQQAREDLADYVSMVPDDAPDLFDRAAAISGTLAELRIFQQQELSGMLLEKARQAAAGGSKQQQTCTLKFARQVLRGNPSSAEELVGLVLPRQAGRRTGLALGTPVGPLQSWASFLVRGTGTQWEVAARGVLLRAGE
jgi:hypothetical protein